MMRTFVTILLGLGLTTQALAMEGQVYFVPPVAQPKAATVVPFEMSCKPAEMASWGFMVSWHEGTGGVAVSHFAHGDSEDYPQLVIKSVRKDKRTVVITTDRGVVKVTKTDADGGSWTNATPDPRYPDATLDLSCWVNWIGHP